MLIASAARSEPPERVVLLAHADPQAGRDGTNPVGQHVVTGCCAFFPLPGKIHWCILVTMPVPKLIGSSSANFMCNSGGTKFEKIFLLID